MDNALIRVLAELTPGESSFSRSDNTRSKIEVDGLCVLMLPLLFGRLLPRVALNPPAANM